MTMAYQQTFQRLLALIAIIIGLIRRLLRGKLLIQK